MYPDFFRKDGNDYIALADSKYKQFKLGLARDDRLQMIAYAHVFEPRLVQVIYPPPTNEEERNERNKGDGWDDDDDLPKSEETKEGFEDKLWICRNSLPKPTSSQETIIIQRIALGENIPEAEDFDGFRSKMIDMEKSFVIKLKID